MNPFGNLLVNLFCLALGLGSLNIALQGIFAGAIDGAGSATFPFATKPLGFLLVVTFWMIVGVAFLWVAWLGVARRDPDDDTDDDDNTTSSGPQPARASRAARAEPIAPANRSRPEATASGAATTRPARLQIDSVAVSQDPARSHLGHANPPAPLELYKSRPYAIFVLLMATMFVLGLIPLHGVFRSIFGHNAAPLLYLPWLLLYAVIAVRCLRDFLWQGPALVLDQYWITDSFRGGKRIPWTDVHGVRLTASGATTKLVLQFRHASTAQAHFGTLALPYAIWQRLFYNGFEGNIRLTSLSFKRTQVMQVAQAFLRHSRR